MCHQHSSSNMTWPVDILQCSGPADVQEIPYNIMECFICNRKSLRGAGNYIRKKAAFIDSLLLIVSRRGIDQIRCRLHYKLGDTLYINRCHFTSCIIGRLATAASLANITVVWC